MPNPALRDRLARILFGTFNEEVLYLTASTRIQNRYLHMADALLASEEWLVREAVVDMARETWDSVPSSYDHNDSMVRRHAAALNDLGVLLARLAAARGTT